MNAAKLKSIFTRLLGLDRRMDELAVNQGRLLAAAHRHLSLPQLSDYEFKVFSQWGEDGILQFLTSRLQIANKTFIEFGVEDFYESNCRFLLVKDIWSGFVIDGSPANVAAIRRADFYWRYPLQAMASFITRENVAELLENSGFDKDLGILSVDIDGVDYHVLEALAAWRARIVIVEYNGVFGAHRAVTVPYSADFQRTARHSSNLYYGASLPAFVHLLQPRGYALVGVNSVGSNAFFVRTDLLNEQVRPVDLETCYRSSCFREGRDAQGNLTFMSGDARRGPIAHLPLLDVASGQTLSVGDLEP